MGRAIRIIVIIYMVALALVGALIGWVQWRDEVVAGNVARRVAPRVLWGGGAANVALSYTPSPDLVCPPARRAANVLLLIDKSESMRDNEAFDPALAAARAFIDTTDLSVARAGVIFFDETPQLTTPLTQDAGQLSASLTGFIPEGRTDLAAALTFAGQVLADLPGQIANLPAVVVLLTDGVPNEMPPALAAGQLLKDGGVRLITVGAGEADNIFLRELASGPIDHFEIADPAQLPALYAELAEQLRSGVAFDIVLVEPVNPALTIFPESVTPAGAVSDNAITWNVPSVPAEGTTFTYRAGAGGLGLRNVNAEAATMNYTDCIAGAIAATLPAGPQLLVLPPAWLALLLALLPLLSLFLLSIFRRPKPQSVSPPPPRQAAPPPDPADLLPAWLTRLDQQHVLSSSTAVADDPLTPTLIIGVGPVGRVVLPQVAQALRARNGGLPAPVRLIQIDVHPLGSTAPLPTRPDHLTPDQWLLLEPNLDEIRGNLARDDDRFGHLAWYRATAPGYERARGRMALFYDLMHGAKGSRAWSALSAAVAGLDKPTLRLVGSTFDDTASGMLVDLARLVQILSRSDVDVQLWLSLPVGQDWSTRLNNPRQKVRPQEQVSRTLATLRELERFQRNAPASFHFVAGDHVQTELHGETRSAVVQSLFLFEPPAATGDVTDHLTTLTDGLLAALYTPSQQAIAAHLAGSGAPTTTLTNTEGRGMVCGLGAYAVRLPLEAMAEALNWRLAHDLLFDSRVGLLPAARLNDTGDYEPADPAGYDDSPAAAEALNASAKKFAADFGRFGETSTFRTHVARRVADIINGEDIPANGVPALRRVGGLARAQTWLQTARGDMLLEGRLAAAEHLTALDDHVARWQRFLLDEVRPVVEGQMRAAQSELSNLAGQTARQWVLPAGGEWNAYRTAVRPWTTGHPTGNTTAEPLLRAAARFGWYINYNEVARDWQVALLAPAGDFVWGQDQNDPNTFALPRDAQTVAANLHALSRPAVAAALRVGPEWVLGAAAKLAEDANAWRNRAAPRLGFNNSDAIDYLRRPVSEKYILVAPRSAQARALRDRMTASAGQLPVDLVETSDMSAVTLLCVRDRLPLYTMTNYGDEAWQRQQVSPNLYVWPGEQAAADLELEAGDERLSAIFVGWIEHDRALVDRFARGYLFDLYHREDDLAYLPGLGEWPAADLGEALDNLLGGDSTRRPAPLNGRAIERAKALDAFDAALEARRQKLWQEPGRPAFLRAIAAPGGPIDTLRRSPERRERDLALYLLALREQL